VAVFRDPWATQPTDWLLLQDSPVHHYDSEQLERDLAWLRQARYVIDEFDCASWQSEADFHDAMKEQLRFPDYYGRNINGFIECLGDLRVPQDSGRALVFCHYDTFMSHDSWLAPRVLNYLVHASWYHLLFGERFVALIHTDDPNFTFESVGAFDVVRHHAYTRTAPTKET
jgi:RNAse (barnase) inhibitor barstar